MSFLDVDTTKAVEPVAMPGDREYKIRIIGYLEKDVDGVMENIWMNKSGNPCFMPTMEFCDEPTAKEFMHYIALPTDDMTEKERNNALWKLQSFKKAFGIPDGKVDLDDTIGNEAWAIIGLKDDPEYGEQNSIKKLVLPKH